MNKIENQCLKMAYHLISITQIMKFKDRFGKGAIVRGYFCI